MTGDEMRAALQKKLENPQWVAEQEREYERIVGDRMLAPLRLVARWPIHVAPDDFDAASLPVFAEPATIEELWLDRWQLSSGGFTVTRLPDDTIRIDNPDGMRSLYRLMKLTAGSYTWIVDEYDAGGRRLRSRRTTDRFADRDDTLFEMHRAALTEYEDLTNDM